MSLKTLLLENKKKFMLYCIGVLLSSTTNIIFTFGMSNAFGVLEAENINEVLSIFLVSLALMLLPALVQLISRMMRIGFMSDILRKVRSLAYEKIMNQDIETYSKQEKEANQAALISDVNVFEKDFFLSLLNLGFSSFSALISFFILLRYSWLIATISLLTSMLQLLIAKHYEKRVREARKQTQASNKTFNNMSSNLVSGFKTLKAFSSETRFTDKFNEEIVRLETVKAEFFRLNKSQEVLSQGLATFATLSIFCIACYLMYIDQIRVMDLIVVINLSSSLIWVMISAISFVNRMKSSIDVYDSLVGDCPDTLSGTEKIEDRSIEVKNLSFSYGEKRILDSLNFSVEANQKLLIYGPSGTGKTTLLNCLAQNLSAYEGSIRYGESDLKDIDHREFLDKTAYIRQTHFMFDDTIRYNIVMNQPYDARKFENVLEQAALIDWVTDLPEGAEHTLSQNGANISGGQRQRISIARELYADKAILFIDEPSSSLDDETAASIYETILNLEKTVICVSHRHLDYLKEKFDSVIGFEEAAI